MKKQVVFTSPNMLSGMRRDILAQMEIAGNQIQAQFSGGPSLSALKVLKFEKIIVDDIFEERLNFIEYLNQTFTYLVCLYAGNDIFNRYSPQTVTINFGTQSGYDVSAPGGIIGECFAVSSVKNNEKLKRDVLRLYQANEAKHRLVYFYSDSINTDRLYIKRIASQYPSISICSVSLEELTAIDIEMR